MDFGLTAQTIELIKDVFKKYSSIKSVMIYGSRAKDTFKKGSDIDLVIMNDISERDLNNIVFELEELMIPYKIDLSVYSNINNSIESVDYYLTSQYESKIIYNNIKKLTPKIIVKA